MDKCEKITVIEEILYNILILFNEILFYKEKDVYIRYDRNGSRLSRN